MFAQMGQHIVDLDVKIKALNQKLVEQHKTNPVSQRLAAILGIGPITAITMALSVNPANFESGRHFASWLGLTPREHSTGGKHRLGRISKAGNERLRQLSVVGAMAVIRFAKPGSKSASAWLLQLLERRPRKIAAIALANKIAGVVWAMMARGDVYRRQPAAAGSSLNHEPVPRRQEQQEKMAIGRTDEWRQSSPGQRHIDAADLFGCHSRNPSGPAAMTPRQKAGHMTAFVPPPNYRCVTLESRAVPHMTRLLFMVWVS